MSSGWTRRGAFRAVSWEVFQSSMTPTPGGSMASRANDTLPVLALLAPASPLLPSPARNCSPAPASSPPADAPLPTYSASSATWPKAPRLTTRVLSQAKWSGLRLAPPADTWPSTGRQLMVSSALWGYPWLNRGSLLTP